MTRIDEVRSELVRRRADLAGHARGPLRDHLENVGAMLRAWKQPERVVLAGMLHSAYSTESYGYRLFGVRDRPRVCMGEVSYAIGDLARI